jgi:hypothetical protein
MLRLGGFQPIWPGMQVVIYGIMTILATARRLSAPKLTEFFNQLYFRKG